MIEQQEYILWAYRLLLGREPESQDALIWQETSRKEIVDRFLSSTEFLQQHSARLWMVRPDFWFLKELANGTRFWMRADDAKIAPAIITETYKPAETCFVRRQVKRGMNVVDIGANIGWFTVSMATLVGPGGRVDAFEPRNDVARHLRRTLAENKLDNTVVHRCALADVNGKGMIAFNERDLEPGAAHLVLDDKVPPEETSQEVELRRLDSSVWGSVDFIKIDVEGAEKLVLDGGEIVLARDRPVILSTIDEMLLRRTSRVSVPDYLSFFADIDYEVRALLPNGRCGEPLSYESITQSGERLAAACIPAEKVSEILLR